MMDPEERIDRLWRLTLSAIVILLLLAIATMGFCRDLPLLVDIKSLGQEYDGKRVTVFGFGKSGLFLKGRMGSEHPGLLLVDTDGHSVEVFSAFPILNGIDRKVIVQGVYHLRGRLGGFHMDNFIIADQIVRDWK